MARSGQAPPKGCDHRSGERCTPEAFGPLNGDTILRQSTIYHMLETPEGVWLSTDNGLCPRRSGNRH